mmetsp:Transcript_51546/g.136669  ORF Transcript_51546/g.136669 Transcript_51546/m.136669 type:complete len:348 (-) Transcript_51546:23-1066(-)
MSIACVLAFESHAILVTKEPCASASAAAVSFASVALLTVASSVVRALFSSSISSSNCAAPVELDSALLSSPSFCFSATHSALKFSSDSRISCSLLRRSSSIRLTRSCATRSRARASSRSLSVCSIFRRYSVSWVCRFSRSVCNSPCNFDCTSAFSFSRASFSISKALARMFDWDATRCLSASLATRACRIASSLSALFSNWMLTSRAQVRNFLAHAGGINFSAEPIHPPFTQPSNCLCVSQSALCTSWNEDALRLSLHALLFSKASSRGSPLLPPKQRTAEPVNSLEFQIAWQLVAPRDRNLASSLACESKSSGGLQPSITRTGGHDISSRNCAGVVCAAVRPYSGR